MIKDQLRQTFTGPLQLQVGKTRLDTAMIQIFTRSRNLSFFSQFRLTMSSNACYTCYESANRESNTLYAKFVGGSQQQLQEEQQEEEEQEEGGMESVWLPGRPVFWLYGLCERNWRRPG